MHGELTVYGDAVGQFWATWLARLSRIGERGRNAGLEGGDCSTSDGFGSLVSFVSVSDLESLTGLTSEKKTLIIINCLI